MKLTTCVVIASLCCLLVVSISTSVSAANIAWISFHADPNDLPSTAAGTFGFAKAPDVGYTDLLRSAGHTVTRVLTENEKNVSSLNSYDLVILSRSVDSAHYQTDTETAAWNGITVPMISIGGFPLRGGATNTRLGYFTADQLPDTTGPIKLTVNNPSHPIFAGIALDSMNTMVNTYTDIVTLPHSPNTPQRGTSINTSPIVPGGVVLATVPMMTGSPPVTVTGNPIAFLPRGTALATGTGPVDTLAGPRLVFLTGSREAANQMIPPPGPTGTNTQTAGIIDLSEDGRRMFLNAVAFMAAIPEPNTAILLIFAAAGLGMLRKR
ncbi:MAG TPA: PEP-CTERM sorting domain-containing protein [Lacipirellulaceae bacterium]|nr:PEP-CTERM sorting domain-containing protein [Lacipirellulaceae bacterium]